MEVLVQPPRHLQAVVPAVAHEDVQDLLALFPVHAGTLTARSVIEEAAVGRPVEAPC